MSRRIVLALALAAVAFSAVVAGCTTTPQQSTGDHPPRNMSNNTTVPHGPVAGEGGGAGAPPSG